MKLTTALASTALGFGLMFLAPSVPADTLLIDRAQAEYGHPARGMSMDAVLARYGEPEMRYPPVGGDKPQHPPITRWVYKPFSVYFEHDHVVDAVVNRAYAAEQGIKSE